MNSSISKGGRQIQIMRLSPHSDRVYVLATPAPGTRCVWAPDESVFIAFSPAEVRLLCASFSAAFGRPRYRIRRRARAAATIRIAERDRAFKTIINSKDRLVRICIADCSVDALPLVQLAPRRRTRVRRCEDAISWWPTIAELDALARFYGDPLPARRRQLEAPEIIPDEVRAMQDRLRRLFEKRHPELSRNSLGTSICGDPLPRV